jgi:hypothetical protein
MVALPLLPMAKHNCPKSGMIVFIERKRGIRKNKIHNDKQRKTNPSVSFTIL